MTLVVIELALTNPHCAVVPWADRPEWTAVTFHNPPDPRQQPQVPA